ncbi:MAG: hypothetical protein JO131_07740 [Gammaproteobacteria bacterium]|nr:hypothetical protein [Gammaproteobacteria bacterium]
MQALKVRRQNCMQVAKWLLQCDYEDFESMDEQIVQWYDDLYDIYVQLKEGLSCSPKLPIVKTFCMILLVRLLCRRLNRQAQISLRVFFQSAY